MPLLELLDEQDKLAGERRLIGILINKFKGKVKHSDLLNCSHMKKREFREAVEGLIEREAVAVDTYVSGKVTGKMYVLATDLLESWSD